MAAENKLGQKSVDIAQTTTVVCEKCGCRTFAQGVMLQEISPLLTGTGQPGIVPVPTFYCVQCGHVNEMFIPEELRETPKVAEIK